MVPRLLQERVQVQRCVPTVGDVVGSEGGFLRPLPGVLWIGHYGPVQAGHYGFPHGLE
ncbi:hypothetical protein GBAR_LOCUS30020 [Geodia barretti]|uniref:Uncharacterized protein n=1 Tax=Geodia barretti TaxID=519541 RepID=A0AA35XJQ8_GEOBA|nr:hypothetical protein GBAR_LOCUS30020 [Geodia barretti]